MTLPVDAVRISGLTKRYGFSRALAGVDLELRAGSMCALLGPNGAGKSTLLGIVSTLVRPSGGTVRFAAGEVEVAAGPKLRAEIGVLAHDSFLYGGLTARENLIFWGRLYGVDDAAARVEPLLAEIGLDERAWDQPAGTYSRGMTQRLALARTMLHDPSVLLLDEPFTGLDRAGASLLMDALVRARARGCVVLVVSHDLEFIGGVTDHVAVLRRGKLAHQEHRDEGFAHAELKELYHRYSDPS